MQKNFILFCTLFLIAGCNPKIGNGLRKKDLQKDVEMQTSKGTIVMRLSDATPLHRNNFLKLVKQHYYDSLLFHRVINNFMIQAGDPNSKQAKTGTRLGNGGPQYTIPAELVPGLFHKKGAIAAARESDDVNPKKASSGSQFYIVQGKTFTASRLDSLETLYLEGKKIPAANKLAYTTIGGTPHLDNNYTVFGEIVKGLPIIDSIAVTPTSNGSRPIIDVRIIKATLIKRKN